MPARRPEAKSRPARTDGGPAAYHIGRTAGLPCADHPDRDGLGGGAGAGHCQRQCGGIRIPRCSGHDPGRSAYQASRRTARNGTAVRRQLPQFSAGRRQDRRTDPRKSRTGACGQLRTWPQCQDDRPLQGRGHPVRAHRRRGQACPEDGRTRRRHGQCPGRRGRRPHRFGTDHGVAAASARYRERAGHCQRRLRRWARAGGGAGLWRGRYRHGHALSADPGKSGAGKPLISRQGPTASSSPPSSTESPSGWSAPG